MGYTNYWHQHINFTEDQWKQIKGEFKGNIVLKVGEVIASITIGKTGYKSPKKLINFNLIKFR